MAHESPNTVAGFANKSANTVGQRDTAKTAVAVHTVSTDDKRKRVRSAVARKFANKADRRASVRSAAGSVSVSTVIAPP